MPKIKVTSPSFSIHPVLAKELLESFDDVVLNEKGIRYQGQDLLDYLADADGVILGLEKMDQHNLDALPNLKIISKYGVGLDNIDLTHAEKVGKAIGWTGGVNKRSVSEEALCFILGLCRNIFFTSFQLKNGNWNKNGGFQLTGKTVGIVGCGHVGTDLVRLLQPFGCNILVNDIVDKSNVVEEFKVKQVKLDELVRSADVVSIHVPHTDETRGMFNESLIAKMKPTALLVNTARGPIVSQNALYEALKNKTIAGAALDVFEEEPPADLGFLSLPNLMVTPHIGGNAEEAVLAMGRSAIQHLKDFFRGNS